MPHPAAPRAAAFLAFVLLPLAAYAQEASSPASRPSPPLLDSGPNAWVDRAFDLLHVEGDLAFDFDRRQVRGRVVNVVDMLVDGAVEVALDAEEMRVVRAAVNGAPAEARAADKRIVLPLAAPSKRGERLEIAIEYECNPVKGLHWGGPEPGYEWKWLQCYSQGQSQDNHFWVPTHDYPNDRATWRFTYRVPKDLTAVGNGKLERVEDDVNGNTRAFTYSMDRPNCTYLLSVAIGPWERYADEWKGVPVEYFVARGQGEARARNSFDKTPAMIDFFSGWIGVPYPWVKYSQTAVMEFVVGGMENVSATTQTDSTLHDARTHLERDSEGLVAHELAHQWWGDYLTCNGWRHLWLNEGFATYFTALWYEHSRGLDEYRLYMDNQRRSFLGADRVETPRSLVTTPANRRGDAASSHVYTKGSSVLHMLRFVLGDADFRNAISLYARRHALSLVETRDLERAVADATGRGLEWFWQEWVYLQGAPSLDVRHAFDAEKGTAEVIVRQTQAVSSLVPLFKMPADVLFAFPDGTRETRRIWIDKAEQSFEFAFRARPLFVRFDEGSWLSCRLTHARTPEELRAQAELDPDVVGRREACDRLGEWLSKPDDAASVEAVVKTLAAVLAKATEHRDVRGAAAAALRNGKSADAIASLTAALRDASAPVRRAAAESLGATPRNEEALAALGGVVQNDAAYGPRASAIRSLGAILGVDAWGPVAEAMRQASEREVVKIAAMETLRKIDPKRAAPILLEETAAGRPYESRERALSLLAQVAGDVKLKDSLDDGARASLSQALCVAAGSNHPRLRNSALRNLGNLDDAEGAALLEKTVRETRDGGDRRAAEDALAQRKTRATKREP